MEKDNINDDIFASLDISNNNFTPKKILCVFQKNSSKEKSFGVSHIELIPSNNINCTIYSGDYPFYSQASFPFFISSYQPSFILIHCHPESEILKMCLASENLKKRIKQIPCSNLQIKSIEQMLYDYYQMNSSLNQICIYTKVNDILSSLSLSAQCSLIILFQIALKSMGNLAEKYDFVQFKKIYFDDLMFISEKSQNELKIFAEKRHPSLVKGQGKSKEGLSLFNLFNKCLTSQGKKLMRNFFEFPLKNEEIIKQRYECINDFIKNQNYSIIKSISSELSHIKDLDVIKYELQKFMINFKIWENIYVSFNSILKIFDIFKSKIFHSKYLENLFSKINTENIEKIFDFVCNCLEFGKDDIRPRIKKGVNELLDKLKEEFAGLDELLTKLAVEYSQKVPKESFMQKFMFVFIPQLGYMLAVEKNKQYYKEAYSIYQNMNKEVNQNDEKDEEIDNEKSLPPNKMIFESNSNDNKMTEIIEEDERESQHEKQKENPLSFTKQSLINSETNENKTENNEENEEEDFFDLQNYEETLALQRMTYTNLNLEFQFHSTEMIYYKNEITSRLDRDYGDLSARITDVENAIFREISKQILEFANDIELTNVFISNLDVFLCMSILSERYSLSPPIISTTFSFQEGRNIITELVNDSKYIKNSFNSANKSIFLVSGNISSGKSVFLRMIGMIAYLSQIGSYVPCSSLNSEIFSKLLSNIEIKESGVEHMSGFTIELREIKEIIECFDNEFNPSNISDCNVLVLMDDPFRRSSQHNQRCLLAGTIKYFQKKIHQSNKNKKCKIFITISKEMKEFLVDNNIIDKNVVEIYEMKTLGNNSTKEIINLYEILKEEEATNMKEKNNICNINKLLIAKENGINHKIFLRGLEILNILKEKEKLFLNVEKINKAANNLSLYKQQIVSQLQKFISSGDGEYNLLEILNKIFN